MVERQGLAVVLDLLARRAVEPRRFEEDDRVRVADRREKQAIGARRRGWDHHPQTRNVDEHRLRALGMVLDRTDPGAIRRAHHHRAGQPATGARAQPRRVVHQLIDCRVDKARELDFRYRAETLRGEADRHACNDALGERCVEHAIGSEAVEQPLGCAKDAAFRTDVLAKDENRRVVGHRAGESQVDGLNERDLGH